MPSRNPDTPPCRDSENRKAARRPWHCHRGSQWPVDDRPNRPDSLKHDYFPTAGWARDHLAHDVEVATDSRLGEVIGAASVPVNSMHHQGIRGLGYGLKATAWSPDGLIEAAEAESNFAVGVQWHPEMFDIGAPSVGRLFAAFIDAAGGDATARLA